MIVQITLVDICANVSLGTNCIRICTVVSKVVPYCSYYLLMFTFSYFDFSTPQSCDKNNNFAILVRNAHLYFSMSIYMYDSFLLFSLLGGHRPLWTDPTGVITSPGYPEFYTEGINLRWTIIVSPGHRVKLTFVVSPTFLLIPGYIIVNIPKV